MIMEFPKDYLNKIIQGDCLEVMKGLPDNFADLILTDPPYGTLDGKGKVTKRGNELVNFNAGEWDRELPLTWIKEGLRVLKEGSWLIVFTDNLSVKTIWDEIEKHGGRCKQTFYWIKSNPPPQPRQNFCSGIETAVCATKGAVQKWNGGGWSVNYFQHGITGGDERTEHTTQKPLKLMEHLISILSDRGDVILDPFNGSGTTTEAAYYLGRNFIGIEISPEYCKIAESRLKQQVLNF